MRGTIIKQTRMRQGIARRMVESKHEAPHFYTQIEVEVDPLLARIALLRERPDAARITMTVALVRATLAALGRHPQLGRVWTDEGLMQPEVVNLGVAVALDDGLVAPALLDAASMNVEATAVALADLAARARAQKLRPAEISDTTFTLSNLGMFGISAFTAIVTPPQVAILATARPVERLRLQDGVPAAFTVMTATLSADHRALDGADAARFLETFKTAMEDPETLLPQRDETEGDGG